MVWYLHCSFWFSVCIRLFFSCLGDERLFPRNGIPYILHTKGAFTLHCNLTNVLKIIPTFQLSANIQRQTSRLTSGDHLEVSLYWYLSFDIILFCVVWKSVLDKKKFEEKQNRGSRNLGSCCLVTFCWPFIFLLTNHICKERETVVLSLKSSWATVELQEAGSGHLGVVKAKHSSSSPYSCLKASSLNIPTFLIFPLFSLPIF